MVGSYSWKETKAPAGYLLGGTVSGSFVLTEKDAGTIKDLSGKGPSDQVIRGGVKIGKWEAETERRDPQGGSSLGGTTFAIVNKSESPVLVGGKLYETGATIATVKTDKDGYWESKNDWLPYGSYAAIETDQRNSLSPIPKKGKHGVNASQHGGKPKATFRQFSVEYAPGQSQA